MTRISKQLSTRADHEKKRYPAREHPRRYTTAMRTPAFCTSGNFSVGGLSKLEWGERWNAARQNLTGVCLCRRARGS